MHGDCPASTEWVIVASGPSAGKANLEQCRGRNVLVVNDAWRLAPWAPVMYAADFQWWRKHGAAVVESFHGERWTTSAEPSVLRDFGLKQILGEHRRGFCFDPWRMYHNKNSGAQALQLAYHKGGRRLILVGFDMKGDHFFGKHPPGLANNSPYPEFIAGFNQIAADCAGKVEIINTSLGSALECFPKMTLEAALAGVHADPARATLPPASLLRRIQKARVRDSRRHAHAPGEAPAR